MPNIEILIDECFPKATQKEMEICLLKLVIEGNKEYLIPKIEPFINKIDIEDKKIYTE